MTLSIPVLQFRKASVASLSRAQSDVDLSVLGEGRSITAMGWAPIGALLLGTSGGKVLVSVSTHAHMLLLQCLHLSLLIILCAFVGYKTLLHVL
jgi:hypothetical protein